MWGIKRENILSTRITKIFQSFDLKFRSAKLKGLESLRTRKTIRKQKNISTSNLTSSNINPLLKQEDLLILLGSEMYMKISYLLSDRLKEIVLIPS